MNQSTPYYIANINAFKMNAKRLYQAIRSHYSNYKLAYSFKTNYYSGFLNASRELGLYAEIVSSHEYFKAKEAEFNDADIIWNGVLPSPEEKIKVIENGGIVNVDNINELCCLIEIWRKSHSSPLPIGLRFEIVSLTDGTSRFGFHSSEIKYLEILASAGIINVRCVHSHTSNARDLNSFRTRIAEMAKIAKLFNANIIDIGGNMYGPMPRDFAMQYKCSIPTLEEYGLVLGHEMKKFFPKEDVTLITENGTALVSSAMDLIASVIKIEERNNRSMITLDCKHSDVGFSCNNKNPAIYSLYEKGRNITNAVA